MPLLKRSAFALAEVPDDIKPNELVFQVRFTKEIFRDYQDYLKRINLYRQRVWACKVTGKANLTYEQALLSESKASEQVQNFPKEFVAPVLHMVQFSSLCVSDLVDRMYKKFKDHFVEGELVDCMCNDGSLAACRIIKVLDQYDENVCDTEGCGCRYEVDWVKEEGTSTVLGQNLKRKRHPLTKTLLKSFIRESAFTGVSKSSRWVVHDRLARMHNIPQTPEGSDYDEDASDLHESENGDDGRGTKRKRAPSGSGRVKYPIDDDLLPPNTSLRPEPCSDFALPMECIGDMLMVWDFCNSFSKVLELFPYSLEDFEKSLCYKDGEATILVETHFALLKAALTDSSLYELFNQKRKRKREVSVNTWKNDLSDLILIRSSEKVKSYATTVRLGDYEDLEPAAKLEILHDLTDWSLGSKLLRSQLGEHIPKRKDSKRKKADEEDDDVAQIVTTTQNVPSSSSYKGSDMLKTFKRKKAPEKSRKQKEEDREAEDEKCPLRNIFLGVDRGFNRYWFFPREGRIFIEADDSKRWSFYSGIDEFTAFYKSLDSKGLREKALKEQIEFHYDAIYTALERRAEEIEEAPSRVGRGKSSARSQRFLLYANNYRD